MAQLTRHATIIAAAAILGGCSFISDTLFPDLFGDEPAAPREQVQIPPSQAEIAQQPPYAPAPPPARPLVTAGAPPPMGTTTFQPTPVTPGQPTGTLVGRKVGQLRGDLIQMQGSITRHNTNLQRVRNLTVQNSQRYHGTVAAINSRLQVGTTPGNPVLVSQWNAAQVQLDQISGDIARMNTLANGVASDSAMAGYLLESTRATYGLTGAVDEDHRQLAILEDEVNRTVVLIDRLLNELSEDINRQSNYIGNERKNLTTLSLAIKNGEILGTSLSNRAFASTAPGRRAGFQAGPGAMMTGRAGPVGRTSGPLVVIRFDRPDVEYQQALYTAMRRALERRPQAVFDLVAVTPHMGSPAQVALGSSTSKRNAENVLRTLTDMGLPADRVNMSATTSPDAQTSEVHIYVR
ncbi:MAG: hypothetical protein IID53_08185 [Proteobacteria bacterium]|nr:hypothetical protein [Pseudomonadota bacterium]